MAHRDGRARFAGRSGKENQVTNQIALYLAVLIVALVLLDVTFNASAAMLFLLRKMVDLVEYLEFWR